MNNHDYILAFLMAVLPALTTGFILQNMVRRLTRKDVYRNTFASIFGHVHDIKITYAAVGFRYHEIVRLRAKIEALASVATDAKAKLNERMQKVSDEISVAIFDSQKACFMIEKDVMELKMLFGESSAGLQSMLGDLIRLGGLQSFPELVNKGEQPVPEPMPKQIEPLSNKIFDEMLELWYHHGKERLP